LQAALLRIFDQKMAVFKMRLLAGWDSDGALGGHWSVLRVLSLAAESCTVPTQMTVRSACPAGTFDELADPDDDDDDDDDDEGGEDDMALQLQLP
jgi:hypothetical protein